MAETRAYFDTSVIAPLYRAELLTATAEALGCKNHLAQPSQAL